MCVRIHNFNSMLARFETVITTIGARVGTSSIRCQVSTSSISDNQRLVISVVFLRNVVLVMKITRRL